jgi:hypothetical protein
MAGADKFNSALNSVTHTQQYKFLSRECRVLRSDGPNHINYRIHHARVDESLSLFHNERAALIVVR